ncbi:DMT family transporter [Faunimonas sp. B44]
MLNRRGPAEWAALAFLVVVFGSSFAVTKSVVDTVPPAWVAAGRIVFAAAILAGYALLRGRVVPASPRALLWLLWLGLVGNVAPFLLVSWGTQHIPSSVAGILMAAVPLMVLLLAHIALPDERITRPALVGLLVGFAGVVALIGPAGLAAPDLGDMALIGELTLVGAGLCYAVYNVTARLMPPMTLAEKSAGTLIMAALAIVPLTALFGPEFPTHAGWPELAQVAVLGVFPTALATLVIYWVLERAGARFLAITNYLVPAFAVLVGTTTLAEALTASDLIGLALILLGVGVFEADARRRRATEAAQAAR